MKPELIEKISLYFDQRSEVIAVYLFGSYAKGRQERDSDIDLAILLNRDDRPRQNELRRQYIVALSHILRKDLHIVIISSIDEGMLAQIFKYGQCIINHNPHVLAHFKMVAYAMIADFGYHKNLMKKGFIRRLSRGKP